MYKTIWSIWNLTDSKKVEFVYYHFGETPLFPSKFFKENKVYETKMLWNIKLIFSIPLFFKCLIHDCYIKL